jgi:hypothetical protein
MKKVNLVLGGLFGAAPAAAPAAQVRYKTLAEEMLALKNKGFNVRRE